MLLLIIFLTSIINVILGIISYQKNPQSATHRLLTVLSLIFALWTVSNYFSLHSATEEETLFWIRAVMFITAPMGPVLYLFVKAFPGTELKINKFFLSTLIIYSLFVMSIAFTPLIFSGVSLEQGIVPIPGPAILLYGFLLIGSTVASIIEIIMKYRRSYGLEKLQLKYLVFGISVTFGLLILTNFLSVVVLKFSELVILGPVLTLIFVGFISYSIIRHRLLEIRLVIARSVGYTLLLGILLLIYTFGVFSVSPYFLERPIETQEMLIVVSLALFLALTYEPLKNLVQTYTDRIFFKSKYSSGEVVLNLTTIIASTINLRALTEGTLSYLLRALHITHGAFVISQKGGKHVVFHQGFGKDPKYDEETIAALYRIKRKTILDEETDETIRQFMRRLNVVVIVPLFEHGKKEGVLLLGEKRTGGIYTQQDINVLNIFAPEISLAIRNASSYEEIKRFNITLREEIDIATEKLKALDKQKDEFLGVASHELKTPITSIKALAQVLHKRYSSEKKDVALLERIDSQANKITSLINDLLNISNIEAGKLVLQKEPIDFDDMVRKVVSDFQYTTDTHKVIITGKIDRKVNADESRIEQVISNLLTNAVKYSPGADKVVVTVSDLGDQVQVRVQDFGSGVPKKDQKKIFQRFYRTEETEGRKISGFGLGLYISAEIIKRHNGKIWVESEEGQGSTFSFIIPV